MKPEKPDIYTAEFRASAVKLANESDKPITQVAKDLGINVNTLHTWISKYSRPKENDKTARTDEHLYDELKRLKKEVARLTEERDLLKKAAAYFAKEQRVKYAWIQQHATEFAVGSMCRFLQVSRSAYYDWLHRVPTAGEKDDADLTGILQSEFNKSRATYGTRRLKAALLGRDRTISRRRIGRLMREAG
jgi:transposase